MFSLFFCVILKQIQNEAVVFGYRYCSARQIGTDYIVLVSTHDTELASLLGEEYDLYHFCESVADNTLSFDYKLKPGPVTERNAIRIIEMCGYPQEVVQEAYQIAGKDKL